MSRILAMDYGKKRTGIAVTDDMQIIASGLTTVNTEVLFDFLENYTILKFILHLSILLDIVKPRGYL